MILIDIELAAKTLSNNSVREDLEKFGIADKSYKKEVDGLYDIYYNYYYSVLIECSDIQPVNQLEYE